jgi:hypothetical protein
MGNSDCTSGPDEICCNALRQHFKRRLQKLLTGALDSLTQAVCLNPLIGACSVPTLKSACEVNAPTGSPRFNLSLKEPKTYRYDCFFGWVYWFETPH